VSWTMDNHAISLTTDIVYSIIVFGLYLSPLFIPQLEFLSYMSTIY